MSEYNPRLRRRRRAQNPSNETPIPSSPEPTPEALISPKSVDIAKTEVEENLITTFVPTPSVFNSFNDLRSEFSNSERNSLIESEYSDETHDWLDYSSSEYANFLGRYE